LKRWVLRLIGAALWVNAIWDWLHYFGQGTIMWLLQPFNPVVLVPIFAIFIGYPTAGLILLFGKFKGIN